MAVPTFTKTGVATWTAEKGRFMPVHSPIRPNQYRGVAGGGQVKVGDLGTAADYFDVVMLRVSKTNHDDLKTFLQDAAINYSQYTFTFTDENSVAHTVRYWSEEVDFPQVRGEDLYNLRFLLKKEIT